MSKNKNMLLVAVSSLKRRQVTGKQSTVSSRLVTKLVLCLHPQTFNSLCVDFCMHRINVNKIMTPMRRTELNAHEVAQKLIPDSSWGDVLTRDGRSQIRDTSTEDVVLNMHPGGAKQLLHNLHCTTQNSVT